MYILCRDVPVVGNVNLHCRGASSVKWRWRPTLTTSRAPPSLGRSLYIIFFLWITPVYFFYLSVCSRNKTFIFIRKLYFGAFDVGQWRLLNVSPWSIAKYQRSSTLNFNLFNRTSVQHDFAVGGRNSISFSVSVCMGAAWIWWCHVELMGQLFDRLRSSGERHRTGQQQVLLFPAPSRVYNLSVCVSSLLMSMV